MNLKQPGYELSYYTLEYPPIQEPGLSPLPVVITVAPFSVAPAYDTHRMVYRDAPCKRNTYAYHRWRTSPGDLVSYRLRQDLLATGLFAAVLTSDNGLPHDYTLTGTVDEFLGRSEGKSSEGVLSVSVTLVQRGGDGMGDAITFHKSYRMTAPSDGTGPPALVNAMSLAMSKLSRRIITDLHGHISRGGNKPSTRLSGMRKFTSPQSSKRG
jgi:ABC-type uncharacterized transport system auxiliary subunit